MTGHDLFPLIVFTKDLRKILKQELEIQTLG